MATKKSNKPLTPKQLEQAELRKQAQVLRQKALRRVRDIRKRGYSVPKNIVRDLPKTVSPATIEYYSSITPEYIYQRSVFVSPEGTKISGTERRAQERSEASKKAAQTRREQFYDDRGIVPSPEPASELEQILESLQAIEQLEEMFDEWGKKDSWSDKLGDYKESDKKRAENILQGARNQLGDTVVAENARKNATRLNELAQQILYESGNKYRDDSRSGEINKAIVEFRNLLYGEAANIQESRLLNELGE